MPLFSASGNPPPTTIALRTRKDNPIDNLQPWHYSTFEWGQLDVDPTKYEKAGAVRVSGVCPVYNCHGLTFASRRTQVDESVSMTIPRILEEDGYERIGEANARLGDLVIYLDDSGMIQHSGIVVDRGEFGVLKIWSKWGKGYEMLHPLTACTWGGMATKFYRMSKWKYEEVFKASS